VLLGPLPDHLREHIARTGMPVCWPEHSITRGVVLCSFSGLVCVLDDNGAVWVYDAGADPMVAELPDGPEKLVQIRAATRIWPELADWLPRRPAGAADCPKCAGRGWLSPPFLGRPCSSCLGLGWSARTGPAGDQGRRR